MQVERDATIKQFEKGELDRLIMSPTIGGIGHNLSKADVMIFIASLYSYSEESQVIGSPNCIAHLIVSVHVPQWSGGHPPGNHNCRQRF
jgi:Helicase conserved C-terminal domain